MDNKLDTLNNELLNDEDLVGFTGDTSVKSKKDLLFNNGPESNNIENEDLLINSFINKDNKKENKIDPSMFLKNPSEIENVNSVDNKESKEKRGEAEKLEFLDERKEKASLEVSTKETKALEEDAKEAKVNKINPKSSDPNAATIKEKKENSNDINKYRNLITSIAIALIEECEGKNISVFNLNKEDLSPIWDYIKNSVKGD